MKILLFGISNVGKTTLGAQLAEMMDYKFIDLDEQYKEEYHCTIDEFQNLFPYTFERHKVIASVLRKAVYSNANVVIAVTPITNARNFNYLVKESDVLTIQVIDQAESIVDRLVFADENDIMYHDEEYLMKHYDHFLKEVKRDISYYKKAYSELPPLKKMGASERKQSI